MDRLAVGGGEGWDLSDLGRRLQAKIAHYGRALSRQLIGQVRFVYQAFCSPDTPLPAKLVVAAALAYFILPTDAAPDFLPAVGFTDDAAVIALAVRKVNEILTVHRARLERTRTEIADRAAEIDALRLDLEMAHREAARLRQQVARWRRAARALSLLLLFLAGLVLWVVLSA